MKKTTKTNNACDVNVVYLSGNVTFTKGSEKCMSIGLACHYHDSDFDKDFTTFPVVKAFAKSFDGCLTDLEKDDIIKIKGHYVTSKYTDKNGKERLTSDVVCDTMEVVTE